MTRHPGSPLALRRQLLVASATLQRARLAQEWQDLRVAVRPGPHWIALAAAASLAALALRPPASVARSAAPQRPLGGPLWLSAVLTLWRLARVWMLRRRAAGAAQR